MRALVALALFVAGLGGSAATYLRSEGPVHPASPWSLADRLEVLRINRALPAAVQKQAFYARRGQGAVLKVREATGPVLLKCAPGVDLAAAYLAYATSGAAPECETQAVDEVGDVLVYEVGGHVSPLCPGQYATLTEEQLHNALYLPALQLSSDGAPQAVLEHGRLELCAPGEINCAVAKAASALLYCGVVARGSRFEGEEGRNIQPDDVATSLYYYQALAQAKAPSSVAPAACGPVPMSVHLSTLVSEAVTTTSAARFIEAQPWSSLTLAGGAGSNETAAALRGFFEKNPAGVCLFLRGIDVERPAEAEMAAASLAFPVFAPMDPRTKGRATPLLRALQRASSDDAALAGLFSRCDLGAGVANDRACKLKRERIGAQLRASLGKLSPALTNLAADEIPYHVGGSGPFHLADYDALHVFLESTAEVPKAKRKHLSIGYQPLWPESLAEKRLACLSQPGICVFRALWSAGAAQRAESAPGEDGFESMVALFARRDAHTRCVRRLFNALAAASEDRMLELQRDLREPVGAGENRAPCDPRARAMNGLVPRGEAGGCPAPASYGDSVGDCRPVSLVFVQEEPWAGAASRIASIAAAANVQVQVSGIKGSEVHRGSLGSWDVLLTVASNYYNRRYPTLVPLLHPAGNQNLSGGQAVTESTGQRLLASYESSIVFPPPAWLGPSGKEPPRREESLRLLEEDVAREGPAPILPLAFLRPATFSIPVKQGEAAQSPWYFERLVAAWSQQ